MTSLGSPFQRSGVPAKVVVISIGLAAVSPKAKQALMMPENVATSRPFFEIEFGDGGLLRLSRHFLFLGQSGERCDADATRHAKRLPG